MLQTTASLVPQLEELQVREVNSALCKEHISRLTHLRALQLIDCLVDGALLWTLGTLCSLTDLQCMVQAMEFDADIQCSLPLLRSLTLQRTPMDLQACSSAISFPRLSSAHLILPINTRPISLSFRLRKGREISAPWRLYTVDDLVRILFGLHGISEFTFDAPYLQLVLTDQLAFDIAAAWPELRLLVLLRASHDLGSTMMPTPHVLAELARRLPDLEELELWPMGIWMALFNPSASKSSTNSLNLAPEGSPVYTSLRNTASPPNHPAPTEPPLSDASPLLPGPRQSSRVIQGKSFGILTLYKTLRVLAGFLVGLFVGLVISYIIVRPIFDVRQNGLMMREEAIVAREHAISYRENVTFEREDSLDSRETQLHMDEDAVSEREKAVRDRENAVHTKEDAMRADQERRERARLYWSDPVAEQRCLGYEMRKYHAELFNIPEGEDTQRWCMETSINIHGKTYDHPDICTEEYVDGIVKIVAHWTVKGNEPTCRTWWGNHEKKECFGSHQQRVEAHLFNHQEPWDNWAEMCFSTPSDFADQSFAHPDTCESRDGIVGTWFINVDSHECP
ncbi:uncharacterized protein FIBRA_05068 [Fibroporia radiculosa]|uniref:Uncharacterized protein n=1 Tax=Fibroporia radiculosa TaxID=599839 RepID=J4G8G4_9APHY|nr:uncharacterized protein FIBRA_05068 [Fibroporia radiculosa]CCM02953.1 predicted protein [Fibroporia radiculosa]